MQTEDQIRAHHYAKPFAAVIEPNIGQARRRQRRRRGKLLRLCKALGRRYRCNPERWWELYDRITADLSFTNQQVAEAFIVGVDHGA